MQHYNKVYNVDATL